MIYHRRTRHLITYELDEIVPSPDSDTVLAESDNIVEDTIIKTETKAIQVTDLSYESLDAIAYNELGNNMCANVGDNPSFLSLVQWVERFWESEGHAIYP